MKKKKKIIICIIGILLILSFILPVRTKKGSWVNDSDIFDIGHYKVAHCNIYGMTLWEE